MGPVARVHLYVHAPSVNAVMSAYTVILGSPV